MVVVLNSLTKTITLSKNQNGGYQVLYEKSHQGINSQFLHKLGIIDSGYKGLDTHNLVRCKFYWMDKLL